MESSAALSFSSATSAMLREAEAESCAASAGTALRAVRENGARMSAHGRLAKRAMVSSICHPFAGPLRRSVPALIRDYNSAFTFLLSVFFSLTD